jgi:hypothetical protein
MAAPFVAGLAALILAKHLKYTGNKTPVNNTADMKNHLIRGARYKAHDPRRGYGTISALESVYEYLRAA